MQILNKAGSKSIPKPWYDFKAKADETEILIYDEVGSNWWTGNGMSSQRFLDLFDAIPKGQKIVIGINSPGGDVFTGLAIYNRIQARKEDVTTRCDGIAASIASVIFCAGSKSVAPGNAQFFLHKAQGVCFGDDEDMEKTSEMLKKSNHSLAVIYAEKMGKTEEKCLSLMGEETWWTADDAKKNKLVDEINAEQVDISACIKNFDLSEYGKLPFNLEVKAVTPTKTKMENVMDKQKVIALLRSKGVVVNDDASEEALLVELGKLGISQQSVDNIKLMEKVTALEVAEKRRLIELRIDACIRDAKITLGMRDVAINSAMQSSDSETVLKQFEALQPQIINTEPHEVRVENEDIRNISKGVLAYWKPRNFTKPEESRKIAIARASLIKKERDRIIQVWNEGTNTLDSDLKQAVLLQQAIIDFARVITNLNAYSTNFSDVPLQGTNEVVVRYYDIDATASTAWNAANGYVAGDTTTGKRKVTINKRQYLGLQFTSDEWNRQPMLNLQDLLKLKVDKLGYDVWADILSVVTVANYTNTEYECAAASMSSNALAELRTIASKLYWPKSGRSISMLPDYFTPLLQESAFKSVANSATSATLREGDLGGQVFGFTSYEAPLLPDNSENLGAFIAFKSAILIAGSPITPTPAVMNDLYSYQVIVHPETGIAIEFKVIGNAQMDNEGQYVEMNYGYALGNAHALTRIVTAAN